MQNSKQNKAATGVYTLFMHLNSSERNLLVSGGPLDVMEHLNTPPASDPRTKRLRSSWENDILVTENKTKTVIRIERYVVEMHLLHSEAELQRSYN